MYKRLLRTFLPVTVLLLINAKVFAQSFVKQEVVTVSGITNENFITPLPASQKQTSWSYVDGFGRPIQSVGMQMSPTGHDIVQPYFYGGQSTLSKGYLPYAVANTDGSFHSAAITGTTPEQSTYYSNGNTDKVADDAAPYSQQVFENSPLHRLLKAGSVGFGFQPGVAGDHFKTVNYRFNDATDGNIKMFGVDGSDKGNFAANALSVIEGTNEDGSKAISYTDKSGNVILKRQLANATINGVIVQYFDTYYIYNAAGMISYVVPPKATALMFAAGNWSLTPTAVSNLLFKYVYDALGRVVQKTVPGNITVYIVYDPLNRPVLMQDPNLRTANKWNYIKYDAKGHAISQGIYLDATHIGQPNMQAYVNTLNYSSVYFEERSSASATGYYTNQTFPQANADASALQPLAYSYYDNYDLNLDNAADYAYVAQGLAGEGTQTTAPTRGMVTMVRKTTVGAGLSNVWLTTAVFYDKYGHTIQSRSNNQLNYTAEVLTDTKTGTFDFSGVPQLVQTKKVTATGTAGTLTVLTSFSYDNMRRPTAISQAYNGAAAKTIASYIYNELGQLVTKKIQPSTGPADITFSTADSKTGTSQSLTATASGSITFTPNFSVDNGAQLNAYIVPDCLQNVDLRYNIRGQLLSINNSTLTDDSSTANTNADNNDLFGMQILYDKTETEVGNTASFSGRVSAVKWMSRDDANTKTYERSYKYTYDLLNRYTNSQYAERATGGVGTFNNNIGGFDEGSISYDENGNISKLKRNSSTQGTNTITEIDNLQYTYDATNANRLLSIADVNDANHSGAGFRTFSGGTAGTYQYDVSGNLTADPYKALTIDYNILNRTNKITMTNPATPGRYINYTYDADGILLRKQQYDGGTIQATTDYIDGIVYTNGTLAYFAIPEGRVLNVAGVLKNEYVLTDQQGNARVSFQDNNGTAKVVQENSYYGFGMVMANSPVALTGTPNKNLFNGGVEWQNDYTNLPDYYQTYYRNYDAVIGRFVAVDPMGEATESLTGYQYSGNNPIMFNDPLGNLIEDPGPGRAQIHDPIHDIEQWENGQSGGLYAQDFGLALYLATTNGVSVYHAGDKETGDPHTGISLKGLTNWMNDGFRITGNSSYELIWDTQRTDGWGVIGHSYTVNYNYGANERAGVDFVYLADPSSISVRYDKNFMGEFYESNITNFKFAYNHSWGWFKNTTVVVKIPVIGILLPVPKLVGFLYSNQTTREAIARSINLANLYVYEGVVGGTIYNDDLAEKAFIHELLYNLNLIFGPGATVLDHQAIYGAPSSDIKWKLDWLFGN